jgi:hypothetical protein
VRRVYRPTLAEHAYNRNSHVAEFLPYRVDQRGGPNPFVRRTIDPVNAGSRATAREIAHGTNPRSWCDALLSELSPSSFRHSVSVEGHVELRCPSHPARRKAELTITDPKEVNTTLEET